MRRQLRPQQAPTVSLRFGPTQGPLRQVSPRLLRVVLVGQVCYPPAAASGGSVTASGLQEGAPWLLVVTVCVCVCARAHVQEVGRGRTGHFGIQVPGDAQSPRVTLRILAAIAAVQGRREGDRK
jgi:hypothetical protein